MRQQTLLRNAFFAAAAGYAASQAWEYALVNARTTGLDSDAGLLLSLLSSFVCLGALLLLWAARQSGAAQPSEPASPAKLAWRIGLWALIAARLVVEYRVNRASTGMAALVSNGKIAASLGLLALSFADFGGRRADAPVPALAPAPAASTGGRRLGKYEVRHLLGRGAMGVVHDGWDPVIARRVAIKTIPVPSADDPQARELLARFRREAQAAGRLLHPNIVSVFDYGEGEDSAYIVMEFVDGSTLGRLLEERKNLPVDETVRIMDDVLAGLQFSHERGIVHRDIKPANIMLTGEGRAKIADFGIARLDSGSMVTEVGKVLGTAAYMSPEQFLGQPVDARSDIFSAGVLLYKLLTGDRPFEGGMTTIMHKVLGSDPPPPSERMATVPRAFDRVVARALAKRPEDRYASAAAFAHAIRAAAAAGAGAIEPTVIGAAAARLTPQTASLRANAID